MTFLLTAKRDMKIHYGLEIYLTNLKPTVNAVRLRITSVIYF